MTLVICERCHKKQENKMDTGCVRCGHTYGRYA